MTLRLLNMKWTETAEGGYTLTAHFTAPVWPFEDEEIAGVIERHGFTPCGDHQWAAPEDMAAPLAMWEALSETGYSLQMDLEVLPPSIERKISDLPML